METIRFTKNEAAARTIAAYYDTPPMLYVHSFGCQQNVNDGEKIKGVLTDIGFGLAARPEDADLIVFNTCAVREHAEQRVFGNVGALKGLKEANPKLLIAVSGCMAQQKEIVEKFKKHYPFVDIVFGVNGIDTLPDILCEKLATRKRVLRMPAERGEIIEDMPIRRDSTFRAWLPIMYGCDNFCSYCIVPYVRGRERSRASADILREFRQLVAEGYKDITLLGQNVNSYGKGLPEDITFAALLRMLDAVPGDYRIRFMTSHPKDATRELIDTIAEKLHAYEAKHIVVDPVMVATSGSKLLRDDAVQALTAKLLPMAEVLTPNIPEAEILSGMTISDAAGMEAAAKAISEKYGCAVLCKGGHQINDADDLLWRCGSGKWFHGKRINNPNTHGTGCTLSSAIASNLAKGFDLDTAVERAKAYISGALGAMLDLGRGSGPMNHMFDLKSIYCTEKAD